MSNQLTEGNPQAKRRTWIAFLLAILSPSVSMMYLGRGRRALVYFLVTFLCLGASIWIAAIGHWPAGLDFSGSAGAVSLIGILDSLRIAKGSKGDFRGPWYSRWRGLAAVCGITVFAVLCFRGFLFEPYRIPSGAMTPTLMIGDYIVVNKFRYGVRLPFLRTMLVPVGSPQRGDVVVFQYPADPSQDYVKRVVGLPGDRVRFQGRTLTINGDAVEDSPTSDYFDLRRRESYKQFDERLGSTAYRVIFRDGTPQVPFATSQHTDKDACTYADGGVSCAVPANSYFVLGDNRDNSEDSRHWGFVPERNVVGQVVAIWWSQRDPTRAAMSVH